MFRSYIQLIRYLCNMYNGEMEKSCKTCYLPNYVVSNTLLLRIWDSATVKLIYVDMDDQIPDGGVVHPL